MTTNWTMISELRAARVHSVSRRHWSPPTDRVLDPAIDIGFMPARAVGADLKLRGERALGDLAVEGGPGQPGSREDGFQADDTVWFAHGCTGSCGR